MVASQTRDSRTPGMAIHLLRRREGWRFAMDFAVSPAGLLVHVRGDWPCAVCRPGEIAERRGHCLCLDCAYTMVAAAGAGEKGARALLDEITEAVSFLVALRAEAGPALN